MTHFSSMIENLFNDAHIHFANRELEKCWFYLITFFGEGNIRKTE